MLFYAMRIITHVYIVWYFILIILTGGYFLVLVFSLNWEFQTELGASGGPEVRFGLARLPS